MDKRDGREEECFRGRHLFPFSVVIYHLFEKVGQVGRYKNSVYQFEKSLRPFGLKNTIMEEAMRARREPVVAAQLCGRDFRLQWRLELRADTLEL